MKRLFFLSNFFLLAILVSAQSSVSLTEGQSVLVYSLPKTELCFDITVEKVTEKPGVFYRYSERYLATSKVIAEEKISYKLKSISVKTRPVADLSRTYTVVPAKNSAISRLVVNKKGILCGINIPVEQELKSSSPVRNFKSIDVPAANLLPLGEEYMMAGSEGKLAEGAAKQIYRIRESRMGILTADVEKLPADGASFKTMMDGLNKMETELTGLFIGTTTRDIITEQVFLTPTVALNNEVLFRLSAFSGVVASDDLSGAPYYISIVPSALPVVAASSKSNKTALLNFIQPATTSIAISDGVKTLYNNKFEIPQFGAVIPFSDELLKQTKVKVKIDPQTGRLLSVE
jgi:hypothetical protein